MTGECGNGASNLGLLDPERAQKGQGALLPFLRGRRTYASAVATITGALLAIVGFFAVLWFRRVAKV